jgi:hypothetical protein
MPTKTTPLPAFHVASRWLCGMDFDFGLWLAFVRKDFLCTAPLLLGHE